MLVLLRIHQPPEFTKLAHFFSFNQTTKSDSPHLSVEKDEANSSQNNDDNTDIGAVPTANDVLLGRGAFINEHSGNRRFRTLALEYKAQFDVASPTDRRMLSIKIVTLTKGMAPCSSDSFTTKRKLTT